MFVYKLSGCGSESRCYHYNHISLHQTKIQALAAEMYKVVNGIISKAINETFQLRDKIHYNQRYTSRLIIHPTRSVSNGRESVSYFISGPWNLGTYLAQTMANKVLNEHEHKYMNIKQLLSSLWIYEMFLWGMLSLLPFLAKISYWEKNKLELLLWCEYVWRVIYLLLSTENMLLSLF